MNVKLNDNEPDPIDIYVGDRLRLARTMRGLSQSYLGSCVDVSFQQIQKYETGANRISASKLAWFARLLGVPVDFFYQGLPVEFHNGGPPIAGADLIHEASKDVMFNAETRDLVANYYAMTDKNQRHKFLSLLKSIAASALQALHHANGKPASH